MVIAVNISPVILAARFLDNMVAMFNGMRATLTTRYVKNAHAEVIITVVELSLANIITPSDMATGNISAVNAATIHHRQYLLS